MPYPSEIIELIQKKYNLTESLQQQLIDALIETDVRAVVEANSFNPESLLIKLEGYVSVLSPLAAKKIAINQDLLKGLHDTAMKYPIEWKEWDHIKADIKELEKISRSKVKERSALAKTITTRLAPLKDLILSNPILSEEQFIYSVQLFQHINATTLPMEEASRLYFTNLLKTQGRKISDILFTPKKSGIQLGVTMTVAYEEKEDSQQTHPRNGKISYYIKTHQHGSTSQVSSIKPVDAKELFVYKLLELMGYGPKVHFFFNPLSASGFFIATQDMAFTKVAKKVKSFTLFENLASVCNADPTAVDHEESRKALNSLDIISRILRLKDTTTNPGNFGLVRVNSEREKWKILDFRVTDDPDFYVNPRIVEGFIAGNGAFNYDYSNFMNYIFKDTHYQSARMKLSQQVLAELNQGKPSQVGRKKSFLEGIGIAHKEIAAYIMENHLALHIQSQAALEDLTQYVRAVEENFSMLAQGITKIQGASLSTDVSTSSSAVTASVTSSAEVAEPSLSLHL